AQAFLSPTAQNIVVDGVPCIVVHTEVLLSGRPFESSFDYYSQDRRGNVWYFGEVTEQLDRSGRVTSRDGSWLAGQDGAQPGIFMEAKPVVGHSFRQEYAPGQAEDQFEVQ